MPNALERAARYVILLVSLFLTSCASAAYHVRYLAELEPPAQYNHPYDGPVDERVMSTAEVRAVCMSMGTSYFIAACSLVSEDGTCHIVLPNDGQAPVPTYRRHEIAHCNGWPPDHPREASSRSPQSDDLSDQSQNPQQDNRADESVDNRANNSTADYNADAKIGDQAADDSDDDVADQPAPSR